MHHLLLLLESVILEFLGYCLKVFVSIDCRMDLQTKDLLRNIFLTFLNVAA